MRGNETGANPGFNATGLSGPLTVTVKLRVSDDDGGVSSTVNALVTVTNSPPPVAR